MGAGLIVAGSWRPPAAYVHGLDGAVVVVTARTAAWLERHADLRRLRTEVRGTDPEVDAVLVALGVAAASWSASAVGSVRAPAPEVAAESEVRLSTSSAADLLGVTDRAVRLACKGGRLRAERVGGRWLIDREDVEHFRAARRVA